MKYLKNPETNDYIFYHGSKKGITGKITPNKNESKSDFGDGFYIGIKENQTLSRVANEKAPYAYEFKIPENCITEENTLKLSKQDWIYFVLYNRGKLEDLKGTGFYQKYATLADGKDFIIGPIADDVFDKCMKDFCENNITDYTFAELINMFDYGTQIVAKSQKACDVLEEESSRLLSKDERKAIINNKKTTKRKRFAIYEAKKAELNAMRKGKYLSEIKTEIKTSETQSKKNIQTQRSKRVEDEFSNVIFPDKISEQEVSTYGLLE